MISSKATHLSRLLPIGLAILLPLLLMAGAAQAQTDGAYPKSALIQGIDGNFYGTTTQSGLLGHGTIFTITPAGSLSVLYAFTGGNDGSWPNALTWGKDGNFYGTTLLGGASGYGTIFKITPAGALTTLYTFTGGADGGSPGDLTLAVDGNLYGSTGPLYDQHGNEVAFGTVFKVSTLGKLSTLHTFLNDNNGASPTDLIQGFDGNFYGSATQGGANGVGTIFKISSTGKLTTLYTFTGGNDGNAPAAALTQGADGNLYGATPLVFNFYTLSVTSYGTVFKMTTRGALTTLYTFTGGADGGSPNGLIQDSVGNLYGSTGADYSTSASNGTLFKITLKGVLTTLYTFTGGADGSAPAAALVLGTDGNFYGTAGAAGTYGTGNVFKLGSAASHPLSILHSFSGLEVGPTMLLQGVDGNFYGSDQGHPLLGADTSNSGAIFKSTPSGQLSALYTFTGGDDGGLPGGLAQLPTGVFYGTTYLGGTSQGGTVFKLTSAGVLTTLHSFTGGLDGGNPAPALFLATDGNFYGATYSGGASGDGTIYKVTPSGKLTTLYSFSGAVDGSIPNGVFEDTDSNFYGTTRNGGANGAGTFFKMTPSGVLSTLYTFTGGSDGGQPQGLLTTKTGTLYGVTTAGGANGKGTVFVVTEKGKLTTLYSFTGGADGASPEAGLVFGANGNLYGTTYQGGAKGWGTVFEMTPAGVLTTLYSFGDTGDGALPTAALILASDHNFYGGATKGGVNQAGALFKLTPTGTFSPLSNF
jgi:uncharacterized repeat protein (TIGR03803 family)